MHRCLTLRNVMIGPVLAALALVPATGGAQEQLHPGQKTGSSSNVHVVAHVPLGGYGHVTDIEIEQELSRPYAYLGRRFDINGFAIISLVDPERARLLYNWDIGDPEIHQGRGGMDGKHFKLRGRYYYVQGFQFGQSGPDAEVGAVVVDVSGLPDTTTVREVARIRVPEVPNGFHNIFAYKHSDGRALLFATSAPQAKIYDLGRLLQGDPGQGLLGGVPVPDNPYDPRTSYHDFYVGYDPATRQDKFYGAGSGGYHIYDVSRPEEPALITSIMGVAGISRGHTFTPTPDGRYAVAETEYQYAPLRTFDLKPGLEGEVQSITRPIGAWTADWRALVHNHEVRWPYVFVSGYEDGLFAFNMMDPTNPYTVGYFYTCGCPHKTGATTPGGAFPAGSGSVANGAWGVDVRNADGLIVISDKVTGFWAFRMDGFDGWNGHQWGMPNISSAQDWDNGPDGAPAPARVS